MSEPLSAGFGEFVSRLSVQDLSPSQFAKIRLYFLDWLGSAIAGIHEPPVRILSEIVRSLGGTEESTLMSDGSRGNCLMAALVNGASSHVVEMDDLHRESILHPAAAIMPAVFALAEREKAGGPELMLAIAAGYEVGIRVAAAAGPSHYRYWHTTATCGTFGAAAGAAKLLRLTSQQVAAALGSAGTQASGLWEFLADSGMSKQLHPGKAAFNGLLSALLAAKGFTGARKILEGEKGFFRATSPKADPERCLKGLGREYLFERNSLKYHASCGHTHSMIDAILQATGGRPLSAEEVEVVTVRIYQGALDLLGEVEASTPYLAKFNLPFCASLALVYGHARLEDFSEKRLSDPLLKGVMPKIRLVSDPELSAAYPGKWPARVEVRLCSGRTLRGGVDYPKGDPENALSDEEVIEKFRTLTRGLLPEARATLLVDRVMALEKIGDVSTLLA